MINQTDQSYASYIEILLSLVNLIGGGWVHQHVSIQEEDADQPIDLSFSSHHPVSHKVSIVRTLTTRASALSSSGIERAEEEKVMKALEQNGYPPPQFCTQVITPKQVEGGHE